MESFFRYIAYVDYYKKGERICNVGFLRWKFYNQEHYIELQLKDALCEHGTFEIKEQNTGKKLGEIKIDKGIGCFVGKFTNRKASGQMYMEFLDDRIYLEDIKGIIIWLNSNDYLLATIRFDEVIRKNKDYKRGEENKNDLLVDGLEETEAASENVLIEGIEEKYEEQVYRKEYKEEAKKEKWLENNKEESKGKKIEIIEPIHEDKWMQLCKEYPNVHPFSNHKVFLSIKPEDFIILQQTYQKLVHNSFLLHGFYNYGYMILGKLSEEEKAPVYIGVPGVYYEREKQAAQMFGFVGFESTEHPVQAGSYGYYMIEVEI